MTQLYRYRVCDVPIADPAACAAVLVPTQLASRRAPLVSLQSPYSLLTGGVSCQPPVDELGTGLRDIHRSDHVIHACRM